MCCLNIRAWELEGESFKRVNHISLEATNTGRPLYERYGFAGMKDEIELPEGCLQKEYTWTCIGKVEDSIALYPEKMDNGSIVKQINFKFGVYYEGQETVDIRLLNEKTVESICLLVKKASWRIQK